MYECLSSRRATGLYRNQHRLELCFVELHSESRCRTDTCTALVDFEPADQRCLLEPQMPFDVDRIGIPQGCCKMAVGRVAQPRQGGRVDADPNCIGFADVHDLPRRPQAADAIGLEYDAIRS